MNEYFFSSVKERPAGVLITELYDEDNTTISSSADLARVCNSFYSNLYMRLVMDEQQHEHEEELLSYIPTKFSLTAQRIMKAPLAKA